MSKNPAINLKKFAVALLAIVFVTTTFSILPRKADAVVSCLTGSLMSQLGGMFGGGGGMGQSVPVNDSGVNSNTSSIKGETKTMNTVNCMLDSLVWNMANTMIKNFTGSVVDWINSGFDGSPSFVTNPEGFFADIGDQVAGQFIEGLGPIGEILCSPFDLQIRLTLGLSLGGGTGSRYEPVRCRLSDVQKNIYNTFTRGQWGKDGWSNWISITQPRNNAYGAYLYTSDALTRQMLEKIGVKQQELSWGNGFQSFRKCKVQGSNGTCREYDDINTPGSVIENQLNSTLGSGQRRLEVADEINEIMDALLQQAVGKVFSSSGLLGMSRQSGSYSGGSYGAGRSYVQSLMTTYEDQLASASVRPPVGINCDETYRINEDRTVSVWDQTAGSGVGAFVVEPTITIPASQTVDEYRSQISQGCGLAAIEDPSNQTLNDVFAGEGGTLGTSSTEETEQIINVAMQQGTASQSSTFSHDNNYFATADNAIDGSKFISDMNWEALDFVASTNISIGGWWKVEFPNTKITEIKIYKPQFFPGKQTGYSDCFGIGKVEILKDGVVAYTTNYDSSSPSFASAYTQNGYFPISIPSGVTGDEVRITRTTTGQLKILEVEVFGSIVEEDSPMGGAETSLAKILSSGTTGIRLTVSPFQTAPMIVSGSFINVSSSESIPSLTVNAKIEKIHPDQSTTTENISSILSFTDFRRVANTSDLTGTTLSPSVNGNNYLITSPDTEATNFFFKFSAKLNDRFGLNAPAEELGNYTLIFDIAESGTGKVVGRQTYGFSVQSQ